MPVPNPFAISYADFEVGGVSVYQLHGPYVIEKSYDGFRLVFDVAVVGGSPETLQVLSESLEAAFRRRLVQGDELIIALGAESWTYRMGTTLLNAVSSIAKTGNKDADLPGSRVYTVTLQAELPADQSAGLRDVQVLVELSPSQQHTVTMQGTYTAGQGGTALQQYQANFDDEATSYLDAIKNAATWELVSSKFSLDRQKDSSTPTPNLCNFTRQYTEILVDQSQGQTDDEDIRDHRITFSDLDQHPGDSKENIKRLRRCTGTYDCSIDIEKTTDLQNVFTQKIKPQVIRLFRDEFDPTQFGIEESRVSYDESQKRLSATFQFLYRISGGSPVVELAYTVSYHEQRTIDYTPVHNGDEFAAYVNVGFSQIERIWNRTVMVVGNETPKKRILEAPRAGDAGLFSDTIAGERGPDNGDRRQVAADGWNIIESVSQVTPSWIGDPDNSGQQIQHMTLTESVRERYHRKPTGRAQVPGRGPTTPR